MKSIPRIISIFLSLLLLSACSTAQPPVPSTTADYPSVATAAPQREGIQNIILVIGDGMGDAQILAGELAKGEPFVFHDWQHTHSNTNSLDSEGNASKTTDSAAGATALSTGVLTKNSMVAKDPSGNDLTTILDHAQSLGKATGIVTTDNMYGATPAGFSGHAVDRDETTTILYSQLDSGIDLLCSNFSSEAIAIKSQITGAGYSFCDFYGKVKDTLDAQKVYWQLDMSGSSPSVPLEKIVPTTLDYLSKDPDGFVMMIEQAHIDKFCHSNNIEGAQLCANSLNNTVCALLDWCEGRNDTVIIITADHETGGLSVSPEDIYENRYVTNSGNALYYQFSSEGHTDSPVSVYFYGFESNLEPYYIDDTKSVIKNTAIFEIMLDLLNDPVR